MDNTYCLVGRKPVAESLRANKKLSKIMLQSGLQSDELETIAAMARQAGIPVQYVPKNKLDFSARKFSKEKNVVHQGVVAFAALGKYLSLEQLLQQLEKLASPPLLVVFDGITDVGNMGAIARSAVCFGAHALIIPTAGSAPVNPEAIKRSAGALELIPICKVDNVSTAIKLIKAHGIKTFAASEHAHISISDCDFSQPCALVLGDENKGISKAVLKQCDAVFSVPISENFNSLNVSVCAGIVLYEINRQRKLA